MDESFTFQIRIITTNGNLGPGDSIDFHIRAQADGNTTATNYVGDDGVEYGGDIGQDRFGFAGANPGQIYQQGNIDISLQLQGGPGTTSLDITKSVSNVMLGGMPVSAPTPGSTIIYKISYSNSGSVNADYVVIYDRIPANTMYNTNYLLPPTTGWTSQYSTNVNPDQSYGSTAYSATYASKTNVEWVRWIKPGVGIGEKGVFIYEVFVKRMK